MKKSKIPKFKSEGEEARFWDTHDTTRFLDEFKPVKNIKFIKTPKRLISMRLDDGQINALKQIAAAKGIGYLTLIRMWLMERLFQEHKLSHAHHS